MGKLGIVVIVCLTLLSCKQRHNESSVASEVDNATTASINTGVVLMPRENSFYMMRYTSRLNELVEKYPVEKGAKFVTLQDYSAGMNYSYEGSIKVLPLKEFRSYLFSTKLLDSDQVTTLIKMIIDEKNEHRLEERAYQEAFLKLYRDKNTGEIVKHSVTRNY